MTKELQNIKEEFLEQAKDNKLLACCSYCKLPFNVNKIKSYTCSHCKTKIKFEDIIWLVRSSFPKA